MHVERSPAGNLPSGSLETKTCWTIYVGLYGFRADLWIPESFVPQALRIEWHLDLFTPARVQSQKLAAHCGGVCLSLIIRGPV